MRQAIVELAGLVATVVAVHEAGHYLAYRSFGVEAQIVLEGAILHVRPSHPVTLSRAPGLAVSLGGFLLPTLILVLPSAVFLPAWVWKAMFLGNLAGSAKDFRWAFNILASGELVVEPRAHLRICRTS